MTKTTQHGRQVLLKKRTAKRRKRERTHRKCGIIVFTARLKLCSTIFMYTKGQQSRAAHSLDSNHNSNRIAAWCEKETVRETERARQRTHNTINVRREGGGRQLN